MSEIRILLDAAVKKRTAPSPNGVHYVILGKSARSYGSAHFDTLHRMFVNLVPAPMKRSEACVASKTGPRSVVT